MPDHVPRLHWRPNAAARLRTSISAKVHLLYRDLGRRARTTTCVPRPRQEDSHPDAADRAGPQPNRAMDRATRRTAGWQNPFSVVARARAAHVFQALGAAAIYSRHSACAGALAASKQIRPRDGRAVAAALRARLPWRRDRAFAGCRPADTSPGRTAAYAQGRFLARLPCSQAAQSGVRLAHA